MKGIFSAYPVSSPTETLLASKMFSYSNKVIEKVQAIRNTVAKPQHYHIFFSFEKNTSLPRIIKAFLQRAHAIDARPTSFYVERTKTEAAEPMITAPRMQAQIEKLLFSIQNRASLHMAHMTIRQHPLFSSDAFRELIILDARAQAKLSQQKALAAESDAIAAYNRGAPTQYYSERNELFKTQTQHLLTLANLLEQSK